MPKFQYNANNTEGAYPTSIDFIDTEIKKDDKIVATDLVDLYDTYPESQTPQQGDALVYDDFDGIWKPGDGVGSSCRVFEGYEDDINDIELSVYYPELDQVSIYDQQCSTTLDSSIYVYMYKELQKYDIITDTWLIVNDDCDPNSRSRATISRYKQYLYMFAGKNDTELYESNRELWIYDTINDTWLMLESLPIDGLTRDRHCAIVANDKLYIIGGISDNSIILKDVWSYDLINDEWQQYNDCHRNIGGGSSAVLYDNKIYVYGGDAGEEANYNLSYFDLMTNLWVDIGEYPELNGRWNHVGNVVGDYMYIFGGYDILKDNLRWKFNLLTGESPELLPDPDIYYHDDALSPQTDTSLSSSIYNNNIIYYINYLEDYPSYKSVEPYNNSIFIDNNTQRDGYGTYNSPFKTLKDCFNYLDTCKTIPDEITLTIKLLSDSINTEQTSLNHNQGYNIVIDGDGYKIINKHILTPEYILTNILVDDAKCFISSIGNGDHSLIIKEDGTLWGTGRNNYGQLGFRNDTDTSVYIQEKLFNTDWDQVKCGSYHSIAIKEDGTLWGTGSNYYGQLGLGDETDRDVFTQVGTDKYISIECGSNHSIAIKEDGTLWATGLNEYGELGLGDSGDDTQRFIFTQVGTDTDWKQISGGYHISFALKNDGTLWGTGYNSNNQLGLGDGIDRDVFTQVGTDTDWKQISCNTYHSIALKENGIIYTTGLNNSGQLGLGDEIDRDVFTQVGTDTDWTNIACGEIHSISLKENGTIWGTGSNYYGQLGLGDETDRDVFTQVGTDTDWTNIACGNANTLTIKEIGILLGTGSNNYGKLGLNDDINRNYFEQSLYVHPYLNSMDGAEPKLEISSSHSIKEIKNIIIDFDITINGDEENVKFNIFNINIYSLSTTLMNNISLAHSNYYMIVNNSVIISSKSLLYIGNSYSDKITISNSTVVVDDVDGNVEWNLWNNSTLIINQIPTIYPTIDKYESTYIIDGVLQP